MARKRRRARAKKDDEIVTIVEQQETSEETEASAEETTEKIPRKEAAVAKPVAKPVTAKTVVKKGSTTGQRMGSFLKDVRAEMKKVSWPNRERVIQSTGVVITILVALSLLMAFYTLLATRLAEYFFGAARAGK